MLRITSTDLKNWAPTRDCQEHLPLLVRRLIRASGGNIQKMLIPVGDNVILPGYDGTVELMTGNEYVPSGISVWEIGSSKEYKEKAEKDFSKRAAAINKAEAADRTFVFVTPYVWTDKEAWVKEKEDAGIWKKVEVIDAQVLEEWTEQCPGVGNWLARFLHLPLGNIQPLDQYWEEWSKSIEYAISSTLVLSGRENFARQLTDFLVGTPRMLSIKALTVQEAIAFCAAVIEKTDPDLKESLYAKAVIVENEQDFRMLTVQKNQLIIIAKMEPAGLADQAVKNGHYVILPVSNDVTAISAVIELTRIKRTGFEKGLEEMGFNSEEAVRYARDSGQSLSVLRRLLKFEKNSQPEWAKNGHHVDLLPALMAGMWDEQKEEDKAIISLLAGEPYEKYIVRLARWKNEKDAPVFQVRTIWRMTSAFDSWSVLAPFVTKGNLENFKTVFQAVLPEINPALDLEPDKRYLAPLYGKAPKFSHALKEGLCQSLILIAVFGEQFQLQALQYPQSYADALVRDLLTDANGDRWSSLHRLLPLLSEASPQSFLASVDSSLNNAERSVMKMFGDTNNFFISTSYYTGLLWALENLLFSSDYLLKATLILGKLARLDPGGNLHNRPKNSLREGYMPWYNQSKADFSLRKTVLAKLAVAEPEVAWVLFLSISPTDHAVVTNIHSCKWRFDPPQLERGVNYEQIWNFNSFVFEQLLLLANNNESKAAQLVDFYPNVNLAERNKLLGFLKTFKKEAEANEGLIWNELRQLLSSHREHSEQHWALPEEELHKVEAVYYELTPIDLKVKYKFIFDEGWPHFPEGLKRKSLSHDEREKLFDERRTEAFKQIYDLEKLDGILSLLPGLKTTNDLAKVAAKFGFTPAEENKILQLLNVTQPGNQLYFVHGYIFHKTFVSDAWLSHAWAIVNQQFKEENILASFLLALPQRRTSWLLLETTPENVRNIYWQKINPLIYQDDLDDKLYIIKKLMEQKRYITLVDKIANDSDELPSELLAEILSNAVTAAPEEGARIERYDIGRIFKTFHTRNDLPLQQLAQLEWWYLPFLRDSYGEHKPVHLLKELTQNPDFFVEMVSYVYRPDNGIEEDLSDEEAAKKFQQVNNARNLLDAWRDIPGVGEGGAIDDKVLTEWITKARARAIEKGRVYGVDSEIGNLLACYPRKKEGWPPEEICNIIETINSDVILSHFRTEIFNSRGVSTRSPYDGGDQERALANYFKQTATNIQSKYPFTATAFFDLAKGYDRDAKDEDERAHLDELR